ncbi:MAG: thioredoxin domain-containing protein [Pirellulales bacterium]
MPNRLAKETSPYLLQHQNNPVDWYPWGAEAFAAAKKLDRPVFLSVGYSACHWCHVMEHESFENAEIAKTLNDNFISVKVDREERPDVDQIYMNAVQSLTGHGGWPMSVFLTPDKQPFYGGTYWPPKAARGMPGFNAVLAAVLDAWKNRREALFDQAKQLTDHLKVVGSAGAGEADGELDVNLVTVVEAALAKQFDSREGGFGDCTKFPHPMDLRLLLRISKRTGSAKALEMATFTLEKMSAGGIYDQLAGGFHRYSVDARWLVPHFEKMLYDNALLASALVETYQATGREEFARTAHETLDFILKSMTDEVGGFHSTLDADSEGEEGKYYVWTVAEVEKVLGADDAKLFNAAYDITARGNFEVDEHPGRNIPNLPRKPAEVAKSLDMEAGALSAKLAAACPNFWKFATNGYRRASTTKCSSLGTA